jgi:N-methylhydantoinase A
MVNIRLAMVGKRPKLAFPSVQGGRTAKPGRRSVYLGGNKPTACPIYARPALRAGSRISGPALIEEHGTTTVLYQDDVCRVAPSGELVVKVGAA